MQAPDNPLEPYLYHDLTPRVLSTPRHFAYIKIAEGCDHPCTFCVIPQYRGAFRSRRFESVVAEATRLFQQGVREINLIGQDTTCYGEDLGLARTAWRACWRGWPAFETPHEKWIRFLYAYPNKVTQRLLDTIAEHAALVKYIDMPLQHASAQRAEADEARRIGRHFPQADRSASAARFRAWRSAPASSSASPARPRRISKSSASSCEAAQFDRLGVFTYSDEDTSASYQLDGKVDGRTIHNRKRRLMAIQRKISRARNRALVGQEVPVLVEGPSKETDLLWEAPHADAGARDRWRLLINDFEGADPRQGEIRRCGSPKRTITTWWARCFRRRKRRRRSRQRR